MECMRLFYVDLGSSAGLGVIWVQISIITIITGVTLQKEKGIF